MATTPESRSVTAGRHRLVDAHLPRFRAEFTAYIGPNSDGSVTCVPVHCQHHHTTLEQADECGRKLRRRVELHPEKFPQVFQALNHDHTTERV